jgi:hypothetical protein
MKAVMPLLRAHPGRVQSECACSRRATLDIALRQKALKDGPKSLNRFPYRNESCLSSESAFRAFAKAHDHASYSDEIHRIVED